VSADDADGDSFRSRALRQARIDLIFKDYEVKIECSISQ